MQLTVSSTFSHFDDFAYNVKYFYDKYFYKN